MSVLIPRMTLEFNRKRIDVRLFCLPIDNTSERHAAHASCTTTFCLCKSCQRTLSFCSVTGSWLPVFFGKRVQRYSFSVNWQNVFATFFEKCLVLGGLLDTHQSTSRVCIEIRHYAGDMGTDEISRHKTKDCSGTSYWTPYFRNYI